MNLSLRQRILILMLPTVLLPAAIGAAGVWLLDNLGRRSEEILRENYVSLEAMANLHMSLTNAERMMLFAVIQGEKLHPDVASAFRSCIERAREDCRIELGNITVPGEGPEAERLAASVEELARRGELLLAAPASERNSRYVDPESGFQAAVTQAWRHHTRIRALNEVAMEEADLASRETARRSVRALAAAIGLCLLLTGFLACWLQRTILGPIRTVTDAVTAIGSGQLHLTVPVQHHDELGRLADAFNGMTQKLRTYRQMDTEQLLRARQTGQATIDSFPDPIVVIDTLGRVESANPAAQRLLGVCPPRDGEPPVEWPPPESLRQSIEDSLRQQRPIVTDTFDHAATFRLDGEDRVYFPHVRPIRSPEGDLLGAAVVLTDVTRFRLLDRLKSDWVATVSHELKTPLTSVRLAVHVLLEEVVGALEPKQIELLIEARDNTERLLKLIEQLLALAKLEDGREPLELQPVDPMTLLRAAADTVAVRAEDKRIALVVPGTPGLPTISVDPTRFGRALNNLLDNAIAYTESGGTVTLSASRTEDGHVRLSLSDTGIGIPPEFLPFVFDRFFRVPGRDGTPGTGLGLAIVREIVTAHHGEIVCESEVGKGTSFHITIRSAEFKVQNAQCRIKDEE